jgi:hypothetical protein
VAAIEQRYSEQLEMMANYACDYEQVCKTDQPDSEKVKRLFGDAAIVQASTHGPISTHQDPITIKPDQTSLNGTSCWFPRVPSIGKPVVNLFQGGSGRYIEFDGVVRDHEGKERFYTIVFDLSKMDETTE